MVMVSFGETELKFVAVLAESSRTRRVNVNINTKIADEPMGDFSETLRTQLLKVFLRLNIWMATKTNQHQLAQEWLQPCLIYGY